MNETMNNKELVAAGHEFARHMGRDTPIIDIAKMVTRLAAQLDVTTAALRQANARFESQSLELKASVAAEIEWEKAMMQSIGADGIADVVSAIEKLKTDAADLAAENSNARGRHMFIRALAISIIEHSGGRRDWRGAMEDATDLLHTIDSVYAYTPATDRFISSLQKESISKGRFEGAYFVANRMLAAWDAGFIDDTAKNAADIARMILTSTDFMNDAPDGDFDRSFADNMLDELARQLRDGVQL